MPHANITRSEREVSMGWAEANPSLFVATVQSFKRECPVTEWKHFVDLSRTHHMKLIAVRRDTPFETVADYVLSPAYLTEGGY